MEAKKVQNPEFRFEKMHKYEVAFLDWPINPSLICWNKHINVFYP